MFQGRRFLHPDFRGSHLDFPFGTSGKEPACQYKRCKRCKFDPWVRKIPWRRKWQPIPVFLEPGESHGQRSLEDCSPWGCGDGRHQSDLACKLGGPQNTSTTIALLCMFVSSAYYLQRRHLCSYSHSMLRQNKP